MENIYNEAVAREDKKGNAEFYKRGFEAFESELRNNGFHPFDINYLNGYFIFGSGTNSVVHFFLEETPDFEYGLWWDTDFNNNADKELTGDVFCQHKDNIDKFKPSSSEICDKISVLFSSEANETCVSFDFRFFEFIKENPELAWYRDNYFANLNYEFVSKEEAKKLFNDFKKRIKLEKELTPKYDFEYINKLLGLIDDEISDYSIVDLGDGWSPRYEIWTWDDDLKPGCYSLFENGSDKYDKARDFAEEIRNKAYGNDICWFEPISPVVTIFSKNKYLHSLKEATVIDFSNPL